MPGAGTHPAADRRRLQVALRDEHPGHHVGDHRLGERRPGAEVGMPAQFQRDGDGARPATPVRPAVGPAVQHEPADRPVRARGPRRPCGPRSRPGRGSGCARRPARRRRPARPGSPPSGRSRAGRRRAPARRPPARGAPARSAPRRAPGELAPQQQVVEVLHHPRERDHLVQREQHHPPPLRRLHQFLRHDGEGSADLQRQRGAAGIGQLLDVVRHLLGGPAVQPQPGGQQQLAAGQQRRPSRRPRRSAPTGRWPCPGRRRAPRGRRRGPRAGGGPR